MASPDESLSGLVADAIRRTKLELDQQGVKPLFGFALCTDDDVRTLFHQACSVDWVNKAALSDPDIGFIYVEWQQSGPAKLFRAASDQLGMLAAKRSWTASGWSRARDSRFGALELALADCRAEGLFSADTLLCVGSTDPSDHLELLTMRAVDRLNSSIVAQGFADALGYGQYRE